MLATLNSSISSLGLKEVAQEIFCTDKRLFHADAGQVDEKAIMHITVARRQHCIGAHRRPRSDDADVKP